MDQRVTRYFCGEEAKSCRIKGMSIKRFRWSAARSERTRARCPQTRNSTVGQR